MNRIVLIGAAAILAFVASATQGAAGNLKSYEGASWYQKYLSVVSGQATPLCSGNSGDVTVPPFGSNIDASHECGSQSETSIAIDPFAPGNVIAGSHEIVPASVEISRAAAELLRVFRREGQGDIVREMINRTDLRLPRVGQPQLRAFGCNAIVLPPGYATGARP